MAWLLMSKLSVSSARVLTARLTCNCQKPFSLQCERRVPMLCRHFLHLSRSSNQVGSYLSFTSSRTLFDHTFSSISNGPHHSVHT
ncbi:hypothetical protein CC80DRAFT_195229 [Byssothecium circinans]|uniref:SWIM-type domain-containing protein n=1 Tax=Byssothecium circinans TaxID=147558 RepID=A0A6A5U9S9_9PLEO|nr:hypothetical protein CC80DRAFT_195229 [Byssothecium circinans]